MPALTTRLASDAAATAGGADDMAARALTVARRTALGVLGDREAAADVAQEVALQAVLSRDALRDPAAFDAWVHRIAARAAMREAGRYRRRRAAEEAGVGSAPGDAGDARADDELSSLMRLLQGLPPRQRAALTLRYAHDLDDDAIARALGCRPATVRSLLRRGREAVRERLDSTGGTDR